jgi:hypothetical protein
MAEQLDLTTPVSTPTLTYYKVRMLTLDRDASEILIKLRGTSGEIKIWRYEGAAAVSLMNTLNTVNLAVKSLEKRILEKLVADGVLTGTISGSPD